MSANRSHRWSSLTSLLVAGCLLLAGCARATAVPTLAAPFQPTLVPSVTPPPVAPAPMAALPATPVVEGTATTAPIPPNGRLDVPLIGRSAVAAASLRNAGDGHFQLVTGDYQLNFGPAVLPGAVLLTHAGSSVGLALQPLGADFNLLGHVTRVVGLDDPARPGVQLAGSADWADFSLWIWVYPH